ncbi:CLUMA_CG018441, isoform A [Clunio marinus]|uniref:CLUMA_CG018441, isoform A n=1 Tax=Clunio marinus TaxID=568069 RepID=A0A1J1IZW6_9DIPT|nr:CLUMA_CG018441, isoform A [Clunio marinus]
MLHLNFLYFITFVHMRGSYDEIERTIIPVKSASCLNVTNISQPSSAKKIIKLFSRNPMIALKPMV